MKKYTFEELMNLDAKELKSLREKAWDAKDVLRLSGAKDESLKFTAFDVRDIITRGVCPLFAAGIIGTAAFFAVKYYADKKYPKEACCTEVDA